MAMMSAWKHDFPIFSSHAHPKLCYLDSAATCLTPKHVATAMYHYQCYSHANSHKGLYQLSAKATELVENSRNKVSEFLNAAARSELVFTSGTTESINIVANSFVAPKMSSDANIVISSAEHHANILPWQKICQLHNAELRIAPLTLAGIIDTEALAGLLDKNTVIVAISHVSNVLGFINPVAEICQLAQLKGIAVLVDGAQAVAHGNVNLADMGCDFYTFSAHKLYGPTGCGVLYAKGDHLTQMPPYTLGGGIINRVTFQEAEFINSPLKFEPGSHNVIGIVGLVEAIDYLNDISWFDITQHMSNISAYLVDKLNELSFINPLLGHVNGVQSLPSLISFQLEGVHAHDVASILDSENVAVRAGHHCAQPLHQLFDVSATVRTSLGIYNSYEDIDRLVVALTNAYQLLAIREFE
jgi:cysteine desulfurase/selenocysteine lyase